MDRRKTFSEAQKNIFEHKINDECEKSNFKYTSKESSDIQYAQGLDRGDNRQNAARYAVGERAASNSVNGQFKSTLQEPYASGHLESPIQFTPEMIRDQEMLVAMMSQRGMADAAIRRQFERLLDEQSRQLRLMDDARQPEKKSACAETSRIERRKSRTEINAEIPPRKRCEHRNCSHEVAPNESTYPPNQVSNGQSQDQVGHSEENAVEECNANNLSNKTSERDSAIRRLEPSSLLKIRQKKEELHGKNNGLQEPAQAIEIIKKCKYTHNNINSTVRFNGAQDKAETQSFPMHKPPEQPSAEKQLPFNGLENKRLPSNPPLNMKSYQVRHSANEGYSVAYPQQKCQVQYSRAPPNSEYTYAHSPQQNYHAAEKDSEENLQPTPINQQENSATPQSNQISQQKQTYSEQDNNCHYNGGYNFYPDLQEPKIIGGFTYFARKLQSIPSATGV